MFERFSDQARRVIVLTQEQAREHGHDFIGAEHMLLAILRACEIGSAATTARALAQLGIDPAAARAKIALTHGPSEPSATGNIPFTQQAKKVLENSLREAQALNHAHIEPSHLLLALTSVAADDPDTPLGTARATLGFSHDDLRKALRTVTESRDEVPEALPYSPQATTALARADVEARESGSSSIDAGHVLLGLLTVDDEIVHPALRALGVDPQQLTAEVLARQPRRD
ncbi:Clp protease N-terminal domain-containing protein [Nocardia iowensis]|uniref:Clp R domain-containing protein n=1 Tax=Nocardia iowensis TaxID=204891 RepID=A0ABX8RZV5_NOCIO|nr:Clp protease N-terminal domain-containing protein [Nocardia iowensis]QXN93870.1 hypothetical protein KV110_12865 [Nocardia iowensis]